MLWIIVFVIKIILYACIDSLMIRIGDRSKGSHKSLNVEPVVRLGSNLYGCIGGLKVSSFPSASVASASLSW